MRESRRWVSGCFESSRAASSSSAVASFHFSRCMYALVARVAFHARSESVAKRKLDLPGRGCARDLAERRGREARVRLAHTNAVRQVVELRAEFEGVTFA